MTLTTLVADLTPQNLLALGFVLFSFYLGILAGK